MSLPKLSFLISGMPLGLFKKVGKYPGIGGLGAEPQAGCRGSALVGVQGGKAPLKLELFLNQNCPESHQLTRMVVTHTIHARGGGGKEKRKRKKTVGRSEKVGKTASLSYKVGGVCQYHLPRRHVFCILGYASAYSCIPRAEVRGLYS